RSPSFGTERVGPVRSSARDDVPAHPDATRTEGRDRGERLCAQIEVTVAASRTHVDDPHLDAPVWTSDQEALAARDLRVLRLVDRDHVRIAWVGGETARAPPVGHVPRCLP